MHDIRNLTISSTNPCLVVYMIDQSGSMSSQFGNAAHSKATELANAVNDVIYETGLRCIGGAGELKNRFEVAVVGYGKTGGAVEPGWEGPLGGKWVVSIKNIFDHPLAFENDRPLWIRPYSGDNTPMTKAFESVKRICNDWIHWGNHMDCHPPIVVNITDGQATDAGSDYRLLTQEVEQIKSLRTNYGQASVLNIHISSDSGDKILFPADLPKLNDGFGKLLFNLSSPLTENMIRIAQLKGYSVNTAAKGYVFNGNAADLINFLNIGTPQ